MNFFESVVFAAICILIILKRYSGLARVAGVIKMFPQFKEINNESGVVLFIVLMAAIIIMIFSVGILTQSMNEVNYAQQQVDQISSDQLKQGLWWNAYASGMSVIPNAQSTSLSGRNYAMNMVQGATVSGITTYNMVVNYDIFQ